ncbi:hypothetical protein HY632_00590 [Candidatus Uhrbacteria bacterium]|nr:hypothetical protein [Candidatus Uhrbacteria bacterium]
MTKHPKGTEDARGAQEGVSGGLPRRGKLIELQDCHAAKRWEASAGAWQYRGHVRIVLGPLGHATEGSARSAYGEVTTLVYSLEDALHRAGQDPPKTELQRYEIRASEQGVGMRSRAVASITAMVGDLPVTVEDVEHPDGALAAFFAIVDAYDAFLYRRWTERLRLGGVDPETVLATMRQERLLADEQFGERVG